MKSFPSAQVIYNTNAKSPIPSVVYWAQKIVRCCWLVQLSCICVTAQPVMELNK